MKSLYLVIQNDNSLKLLEQPAVAENSSDTEARKSYQLSLVDSFPLLSKYYDEILDNPELYYVPINEIHFGSSITGSTKLFLGDLLTLWQDEPWHTTCPKCNSQSLFIFGAGGSPLSGSGSAWGVCKKCRENIGGVRPFGKFFGAVLSLKKHPRPKQVKASSLTIEKVIAGAKQ